MKPFDALKVSRKHATVFQLLEGAVARIARGRLAWPLSVLLFLQLPVIHAFCATNDMAATLQKGLFEEEANHNFNGAIELYQTLISQFDRDRKLAATAIFRLGECFRKQGKTNEAAAQYERILREFDDQQQLTPVARQNLATLGVTPEATARTGARLSKSARERQKELLEQELKLVQQKLAMQKKQIEVGTLAPEELWSTERESLQLQRQIVGLDIETKPDFASQPGASSAGPGEPDQPGTMAEAEEVRRIQAMIKNSPDLINAAGDGGKTPLNKAALQGQLTVARFLLANGADIEAADRGGGTPLHSAAYGGHKAMTELLLEHKARVDARDNAGTTPLQMGLQRGFRNIVELLLAKGADVNARDHSGSTPLSLATSLKLRAIAEFLINKGADVNAPYEGDGVNENSGNTPLHFAVREDDAGMTELLLRNKANPNSARRDGKFPLDLAASKGALELGQLLFKHGADVNATNSNPKELGWTALHYAAIANRPQFVSWLLEAKANPNARISAGFYVQKSGEPILPGHPVPLPTPAFGGGSVTDAATGYTPLMFATSKGFPEVVNALLRAKADPNLRTQQGDFALILSIFEPENVRSQVFASLLAAGADIEMKDPEGRTPLLRIAAVNAKDLLELLLPRHPNLDARDDEGNTALHLLAGTFRSFNRNPTPRPVASMAELLLHAGADVNAQNAAGKTALELLLQPYTGPTVANPFEKNQLVQVLRAAGAVADIDVIRIRRPSNAYESPVFTKSTNDFNRFTMFELIAVHYGFISTGLTKGNNQGSHKYVYAGATSAFGGGVRTSAVLQNSLPFPDLEHVTVRRVRPIPATVPYVVSALLSVAARGSACTDVNLEWGDVVEITETDHPVSTPWLGLSEDVKKGLEKCLTRTVTLTIKGQSTNVVLAPAFNLSPQVSYPDSYTATPPQFSLLPVLVNSGLIRTSSDLSRVKITRRDPEKSVLVLDCRTVDSQGATLWLRDGDQIEVPEKPER